MSLSKHLYQNRYRSHTRFILILFYKAGQTRQYGKISTQTRNQHTMSTLPLSHYAKWPLLSPNQMRYPTCQYTVTDAHAGSWPPAAIVDRAMYAQSVLLIAQSIFRTVARPLTSTLIMGVFHAVTVGSVLVRAKCLRL